MKYNGQGSGDQVHEDMKQRRRRNGSPDRAAIRAKLRTILLTHVDKMGNVMSPAGLANAIRGLLK